MSFSLALAVAAPRSFMSHLARPSAFGPSFMPMSLAKFPAALAAAARANVLDEWRARAEPAWPGWFASMQEGDAVGKPATERMAESASSTKDEVKKQAGEMGERARGAGEQAQEDAAHGAQRLQDESESRTEKARQATSEGLSSLRGARAHARVSALCAPHAQRPPTLRRSHRTRLPGTRSSATTQTRRRRSCPTPRRR